MCERKRKYVLLDLDDTILDFHTAERTSIAQAFQSLGLPSDEAVLRRYSEINAWCWQQLECGAMERAEILVRRFELLFSELGFNGDPGEAQHRYESLLKSGHYFVPGAIELLETISPRYELYLISNGNASTQESRLKSAQISHYFKDIFISELVGHNKPSPAFYEACFKRILDFRPEDAVVVGDSLTSDIQGGINMGLTTCWFNPGHAPARVDIPADYEFGSLDALPALLERIFGE